MGNINKVIPVKLISGLITQDANNFILAHKALQKKFGKVDFISPVYNFDMSDYYEKEMGIGLKRQFVSFHKLTDPIKLAKTKITTNNIERKFLKNSKRLINIDPGYISASKLILATTKDFSHRLYLGKGIYAEVTLHFRDKTYNGWEWTYPDYKSKNYIGTFNRIREIYMEQMKNDSKR